MPRKKKVTGAGLIQDERAKQIKRKFDVKHDLRVNGGGQLTEAVLKLVDKKAVAKQSAPRMWDKELWAKMQKKQRKEKLIVAGALIAAEIDCILAEEE